MTLCWKILERILNNDLWNFVILSYGVILKSKNLFLCGSVLILSCLFFNVHANESDLKSNEPIVTVSTILDDGSNDSGRYSIGDGDIVETNLNDVEKEKDLDVSSESTYFNIEPTNLKKKSDVNFVNVQNKLESNYDLEDSATVNNLSKSDTNSLDKIENHNDEIVNSIDVSDKNDNDNIGKLVELKSLNKPIGKVTRLKSSLPLTGMMNTKQAVIASLVLMLTGLISLLYGFSRKYLGWYYDMGD